MDDWRSWTRGRLEREYSPSSVIGGDYGPSIGAYARLSRLALGRLRVERNLAYGSGPDERLDVFPAGPGAPLVVFLHGGYWQELSKDESLFPALGLVPAGVAFAAIDYTLAPRATLDGIVDQARRALAWLIGHAGGVGIDPARIVVAGHSAGAHLAAMAALADPPGRSGPRAGPIAGLVLVSGVYDLEPLLDTSVNEALGMDLAAARRNSPLALPLLRTAPAIVTWGEHEPAEFKRQSRAFAAAWAGAGNDVHAFETSGRNHFDVILDLGDPATRLGQATIDLALGPPEARMDGG